MLFGGGLGGSQAALKPAIIVALAGQSNARGIDAVTVSQTDRRLLMMQPKISNEADRRIQILADPVGGTGYSTAHDLGTRLRALAPDRTVIVVNYASSGTTAADWAPGSGTGLYTNLISRLKEALAWTDSIIGLVWWMQGESNCLDSAGAADFASKWPTTIAQLKTDLTGKFIDANHCVGFNVLPATPPGPNNEQYAAYWESVRQSIIAFPTGGSPAIPGLIVLNSPNGPWVDGQSGGPGLHLAASAMQTNGVNIANTWAGLVTL